MAEEVDIGTFIVRTPGTLGGRPRIDGTRLGVDLIAAHVAHGTTPQELASEAYWPYITLAQVYAALAYYHAHKDEIDAHTRETDEYAQILIEEAKRTGGEIAPGTYNVTDAIARLGWPPRRSQ
jgi:uncharacterized protein (DUF433 family)